MQILLCNLTKYFWTLLQKREREKNKIERERERDLGRYLTDLEKEKIFGRNLGKNYVLYLCIVLFPTHNLKSGE